jgi:transposase
MEREKRRHRSKQERREIVEETLKPGASVAVIARAHGVNANQVFGWRKLYREGRLDVGPATTALIPVRVAEAVERAGRVVRENKSARVGIIDIDLGHARVRIEGAADPACVRAAVEGLVRR